MRKFLVGVSLVCSLSLGLVAFVYSQSQNFNVKPKLAVLVVFDQLRGDYLFRWQEHYPPGGFKRLISEGAVFDNCHYPYAGTITGAGHASLATGTTPSVHGIIGNDWYDRNEKKSVYCAASSRWKSVPEAKNLSEKDSKRGGGNPDRLLAPTIADALKKSTQNQGKVISLSFKDRSAVLPGGFSPNSCLWFDPLLGMFQTSTFYPAGLPRWAKEFNESDFIFRWKGRAWEKYRTDLDYHSIQGADDQEGEGTGKGQGKVFPHPFGKTEKDYFDALYTSPFGNEVILDLAKKAIVAENLGKNASPDLLMVSFSCNDPVGHSWGPDSQEVFDVTLRTDRLVNNLLDFLDKEIGRENYTLVLSADHGICPLPEVSKARGLDAGRVNTDTFAKDLEMAMLAKFEKLPTGSKYLESFSNGYVYFNQAVLKKQGIALADAVAFVKAWSLRQTGILAAYSVQDFLTPSNPKDPFAAMIANSYYPGRSGDLYLVLKPYYVPGTYLTGTTHGSPHSYDTHVPLVVFGANIQPGLHHEKVPPTLASAILAKSLGIPNPEKCKLSPPDMIWKKQ